MTQTASISSLNRKSFLKKAFKEFGSSRKDQVRVPNNPPLPIADEQFSQDKS